MFQRCRSSFNGRQINDVLRGRLILEVVRANSKICLWLVYGLCDRCVCLCSALIQKGEVALLLSPITLEEIESLDCEVIESFQMWAFSIPLMNCFGWRSCAVAIVWMLDIALEH